MSIMRNVQDADCSGRALATLLITWVLTAMIASILLQWDYMWIVLMVLTMLVLVVCGYTAYNVKKAHTRFLLEEQRRAAIRTVSGMTDATHREVLRFMSQWIIIYRKMRKISANLCICFLSFAARIVSVRGSPGCGFTAVLCVRGIRADANVFCSDINH